MIIVYNYKNKKPFTIIGKKKSGSLPDEPENPEIPDLPDGVLPEVADNEDILAIKNVDEVEGTVKLNNPNNISIQYSTNGTEFNDYTTETEVTIGVGKKVYFKWSDVINNSSNSTALVSSNVKYKTYGELKQGNNEYAYYKMFSSETNLIDASKLKLTATTLAGWCYSGMFAGCTSLTTAPALPATTLAERCYYSMFSGCTSLTQAPQLPATTLAKWCYSSMFKGCTSLTQAPQLPATTIPSYCYQGMFYGCTSLTQAPQLPATELDTQCYTEMFYGCTSLTTAELLATKLVDKCYQYMFYGCTSLNYVKHHIVTWFTSSTSGWLSNVSANGTMYCPLNSTIPSNSTSGIPSGWIRVNIDENGNVIPDEPEIPEVAENEDILVVENVDTVEGTVKMTNPYNKTIQYSTDGSNFNKYTTASEIPINPNEKVYFKWSDVLSTSSNQNKVNSTVKYKVYGELKQGKSSYAYYKMFYNESNLTDVSKLKLPATTLAEWCYSQMFSGCTSITNTPELPATTLSTACYYGMFSNCTSLTTAPELPATTLSTACYNSMFSGCTSLTTAPELPATKLVSECYYRMFRDCTSLNYVKHHIVTWFTSSTSGWLSNVSANGTMYCPLNSTIPSNSTSGIPSGWLRVAID